MKISITARLVSRESPVYVLRAGSGAIHQNDFLRSGSAFLELANIKFNQNEIDSFSQDSSSIKNKTLAKIICGRKVAQWHLTKEGRRPSSTIKDYLDDLPKGKRPKYLSEAASFYGVLPIGTVLVVPPASYKDKVLIGILTDSPSTHRTVSTKLGERTINWPARSVEWFANTKEKRFFSIKLIEELGLPPALYQLSNDSKKEIFDAAFDSYSLEDSAGGEVHFSSEVIDPFALTEAIRIFQYFAAAFEASGAEGDSGFFELSIDEAIRNASGESYFFDTAIHLQSPGWWRLWSENRPMVYFISVMTAVAIATSDPAEAIDATVVNEVKVLADSCEVEVTERMRQMMRMMHVEKWEEVCQRVRRSAEQTGMSVDATVSAGANSENSQGG